jgi:predicted DNA-binding transcriptional regulator AlpA
MACQKNPPSTQTTQEIPTYLTAVEVEQLLRASRASIFTWVREGRIPPPLRIGRKRLWDRQELVAHIAAQHKEAIHAAHAS